MRGSPVNNLISNFQVILAACSPYFRAMFTGAMSESSQTEVTIRDVDETAMDILIDFCYTSHIVVEESNVQTLLPAACLLQLAEIQVGQLQGVSEKMSHFWETKSSGTSYSETTHLLGLRLWLQGVLMRALCCRSFRSNRCLVSEYEVPSFLGSQEWETFSGTPCTKYIKVWLKIDPFPCCLFIG